MSPSCFQRFQRNSFARLRATRNTFSRVLTDVGLPSAIIVPLTVRGRTLGAISLIFAESGRQYAPADLMLAMQLASREAVAVDNARLYLEARFARHEAEHARIQAEEANQAKSAFLASMSHELRTPMNAITGYTDLLGLGIAGPLTETHAAHLARIKASTNHLLGLVNDVLDLAKVESGQLQFEPECISVSSNVREALTW